MNVINPADEQFQYVAVPQRFVPSVYQLLAELSLSEVLIDDDGIEPDVVEVTSGNDATSWTDEMLERFAAGLTKTTQIAGEIMDVLAQSPDEKLSIDELAERTGRERSQVKALWTHVARHLRKHYGVTHPPLTTKWGADLEPARDNVVYYFVTPEQADAWRAARTRPKHETHDEPRRIASARSSI